MAALLTAVAVYLVIATSTAFAGMWRIETIFLIGRRDNF
jgi:hypothetical protein